MPRSEWVENKGSRRSERVKLNAVADIEGTNDELSCERGEMKVLQLIIGAAKF